MIYLARGFVTLLAAGVLFGCKSDNPTASIPTTPEGEAAGVIVEAVVPAITQTYLGAYVGGFKKPGGGCGNLSNVCSGGSAEYCPGSEGGVVNFTACGIGGYTVDGSIDITGDALFGTADFDLHIGDVTIDAEVAYSASADPPCLHETFSSFSALSPKGSVNGFGGFSFCDLTPEDGRIFPTSGNLNGLVTTNKGSYGYSLWIPEDFPEGEGIRHTASEKGDVTIVISTPDFSEPLLYCYTNVYTREVDCEPVDGEF